MIDIGQYIYKISAKQGTKHTKEIEGQTWYRFETFYTVSRIQCVGKTIVTVSGEVDPHETYEDQLHFKSDEGVIWFEYANSLPKNYFLTEKEALLRVEELTSSTNNLT